MTAILFRSTNDFDVSGDGRTLEGLAFRWDLPSLVEDDEHPKPYLEEFDPRSANQTLRLRALWPLFVEHQHLKGSAGEVLFERSAEGLVFTARTSDSKYAQLTLERVKAGELPEVSAAFYPVHHRTRSAPEGLVTRRTEIRIAELSVAREGQHRGAKVLAIRSAPAAAEGTPRLDALRRKRSLLRR